MRRGGGDKGEIYREREEEEKRGLGEEASYL